MKFFSILFFFFSLLFHSQIQDWKGILSGDFQTLKKENIKSLVLRKNGEISKKMEIGENNIIVYNIDKLSEEFYFRNDGELLKYKSIPKISVEFLKNSKIKSYYYAGEEVLKYEFDDNSKELLFEKKITDKGTQALVEARYFVKNTIDNTLSYQEFFFKNGRSRYYEDKDTKVFFRPLRDYTGAEINDRQIAKDSLISGKKQEEYYFNKNNKLINKRIIKDSIYETGYENNKIDSYIVEFKDNRYLYEKYRNGILDVRIKNIYYPTENGTLVLWKVSHYDVASKKTYIDYPNRKEYRLRKNVLVEKKQLEERIIYGYGCGGININDRVVHKSYVIQTFSNSILFDEKLQQSFSDNFDTSSIDLSINEIFNASFIFSGNPLLINNSENRDAADELITTSKWVFRRKERWNTYFKNFQVDAITNSNKKYTLDLTGQFENFSFPINVIFIQN